MRDQVTVVTGAASGLGRALALLILCAACVIGCAPTEPDEIPTEPADWDAYPVPVDPGDGNVWELQPLSDEFNYAAQPADKGRPFTAKWVDTYHNAWLGPGRTEWRRDHSWVEDGRLVIAASRKPDTDQVYAGIIPSKTTVVYPVYLEAGSRSAIW